MPGALLLSVLLAAASPDPESTLMAPDNPTYMGFALLAGPGFDPKTVDSAEALAEVCRSLGVPREQVLAGYRQVSRLGVEGLLDRLVGQIQANLDETDPARYTTHVVYPYLALLHHGRLLRPELENSILKGFCQAFPGCAEGNPLRKFATDFKRQMAGGSVNNQSGIELNGILRGKSLHLRCDFGQTELYRVSDTNIRVGKHGIGDVIVLERALPFQLGQEVGLAIIGNPDVYITRDHVTYFLDRMHGFLEGGKPPIRYAAADLFWRREGIAMTAVKADSINARLARMEWNRDNLARRGNDFLVKIALHEVRHKWDEQRRGSPRYVTDLEYLAHTSEILFGPLPLQSLTGTIRRLEDYCRDLGPDRKERAVLLKEVGAMWGYAEKIAAGTMTVAELRKAVRKQYAAFVTVDGGDKGDLGVFEALAKTLVVR